jgi:putative hydrolase of the HAD superfamily|tara:strand:+ start:1420 stop:2181 length:762 start_codon:yes stop_codon:yes gene_type:complete
MRLGITFDLWLTLIAELDGTQKSIERRDLRSELTYNQLRKYGEQISIENIINSYNEISDLINNQHNDGEDFPFDQRIYGALNLMSPGLPDRIGIEAVDKICKLVDSAFFEQPPKVFHGCLDTLKKLKTSGLILGLISNTGLTSPSAYKTWLMRENIFELFTTLTFSNEVCLAKPKIEIFLNTLKKMQVAPHQAIHVGDNLHTDIRGASDAGMFTAWIKGYDNRSGIVDPNYSISSVTELPKVLEHWEKLCSTQ